MLKMILQAPIECNSGWVGLEIRHSFHFLNRKPFPSIFDAHKEINTFIEENMSDTETSPAEFAIYSIDSFCDMINNGDINNKDYFYIPIAIKHG